VAKSQISLFKTETDLVMAILEMGYDKISIDTNHLQGKEKTGEAYVMVDSKKWKLGIGHSGDTPLAALKLVFKSAEHFDEMNQRREAERVQSITDRAAGHEACKYGIHPYDPHCRDECPLFEACAKAHDDYYQATSNKYVFDINKIDRDREYDPDAKFKREDCEETFDQNDEDCEECCNFNECDEISQAKYDQEWKDDCIETFSIDNEECGKCYLYGSCEKDKEDMEL
jgi:hypothetical protein